MARFCICGCERELVLSDGSTDYKRMFYSKACRDKDSAQRMRDQRKKIKGKNICPTCRRPMQK